MADDCVFCRIVSGDIPADLVVDEEDVIAFPDMSPKADVHVLVVPRRHVGDVVELADDPRLLAAVVAAGGRVAAERSGGQFRLVFNTGAEAGQTVFHAHGHVLAGRRLPGDDL